MKRLFLPVLFLAGGLGIGWAGARRGDAARPDPTSGGWETAAVERREIGATVLATGVVRPRVGAQVAVGSRASGVLKKLHVTVGDRVRAGQLLAELDPVEYATTVERADAQRVAAAAELAWATTELDRIRQLVERDAATKVELSGAQRAVDLAAAREREAAAAVAAARVQLGYTRIFAPIGGVVGSVSTQEGETVAASFAAPTFVTIVDLDRLEVQAYVDETDIGRIEVGQRARFTVDSWPDEAFEGRVTAVRPTAELRDNVVNYITLIDIEKYPGRLLRPEMTATIGIALEGRTALAVPNAALRRDANGTYALVPTAAGLERRTIRIGFRGSDASEALEGLRDGERVVTGSAQACEAVPTDTRGA
jgi:macrolide-specific efflux system membrane fusion protein